MAANAIGWGGKEKIGERRTLAAKSTNEGMNSEWCTYRASGGGG